MRLLLCNLCSLGCTWNNIWDLAALASKEKVMALPTLNSINSCDITNDIKTHTPWNENLYRWYCRPLLRVIYKQYTFVFRLCCLINILKLWIVIKAVIKLVEKWIWWNEVGLLEQAGSFHQASDQMFSFSWSSTKCSGKKSKTSIQNISVLTFGMIFCCKAPHLSRPLCFQDKNSIFVWNGGGGSKWTQTNPKR